MKQPNKYANQWPVPKLKEFEWPDNMYEDSDSDLFHIGQIYVDDSVPTLKCKKCGSIEFNVGSGDHYTAIRCPKCKWEECIHDG